MKAEEKITWKWVAGIAGSVLFAAACAWAARVERGIEEITSMRTSIQYIQRDIEEIKDIMKGYLGK